MFYKIIVLLSFVFGISGNQLTSPRLYLALEALDKGLQFMQDQITEINLDAVFGVRLVQEQLQAYLRFEPDVFRKIRPQLEELRNRAETIADEGETYVKENEKEYSLAVGGLMSTKPKLLWYPNRNINPAMIKKPKPCSESVFNEEESDHCLKETNGLSYGKSCKLSKLCRWRNSEPRQRGYVLTHQMLYWQLVEMGNCTGEFSLPLQVYLCSNVMRDVEEIANAKFPLSNHDLFMEQIGLCGIWGFGEFYKPEWLDMILKWQQPSGCFAHRSKWYCMDYIEPDTLSRVKRREKMLEEGCLSHKTTVALLAIIVSLRFEAERLYAENK